MLFDYVLNEDMNKYDRGIAGLLFIGTQTGLRNGELTILETDGLEVITKKGMNVAFIHYRSTKNALGKKQQYTYAKTNANAEVVKVWKVLEKLFEKERVSNSTKLLIPGNELVGNNIPTQKITHFIIKLCIAKSEELKTVNRKDSNLFCGKLVYNDAKIKTYGSKIFSNKMNFGDIVSYPTVKQFRVYVATERDVRGVSYRASRAMFNHETDLMDGYYVRQTHKVQEDIHFTKNIFREVLLENTKILGSKGDMYEARIKKFIENKGFNIATDIEEILDALSDILPVRAKKYGYCIHMNVNRSCRHDAKTDEFMCAYGCCPNHCHMYFMLPITYKKLQEMKKVYDFNLENGFVNQSQKEWHKIKYCIEHEFIPEFNETIKKLEKDGPEEIIEKHNEMADVIYRMDEIKEEVLSWEEMN